jgi:quercetin dioxygenase-like cupin family protein
VVLLLSLSLLLFLGLHGVGAQKAGLTYLIELDSAGGSAAGAKDAPGWADIGVDGWSLAALSDAGVDLFIYKVAPGKPLAIHKSDLEWLAYVLEGNGQLILADAAGKQTGVVEFKKGDFMVFRADTMHGWKGGTAEALMLFVTPTKK